MNRDRGLLLSRFFPSGEMDPAGQRISCENHKAGGASGAVFVQRVEFILLPNYRFTMISK